MRILLFLTCFASSFFLYSQKTLTQQNEKLGGSESSSSDFEQDSTRIFQPTLQDYLFWKQDQSKQPFDTALVLHNQYRYTQYNNKDNFGKIAFNNLGQPFNPLLYEYNRSKLLYVPYGKSHIVTSTDDLKYYDVKTPTTLFTFHNGMKEGQALNTLFTHNINSQINYAIEYKGIRSLGHYLESEVDSRTLTFSTNYHTKNHRYNLWAHYYNINYGSVENEGIQNIEDFTSGDRNFKSRQRLVTNLTGVRTKFLYRRYFLGQQFSLIRKPSKDSIYKEPIVLRNDFSYESMNYRYLEKNPNTYYIPQSPYLSSSLKQVNTHDNLFTNLTSLVFNLKDNFTLQAGFKWNSVKLFTQDSLIIADTPISPSWQDDRLGFFGKLKVNLKNKATLTGAAEFMTGNIFKNTYFIEGNLSLSPNENFHLNVGFDNSSETPQLVLLYNPSIYTNFNYNFSEFSNENHTNINAQINYKPWQTYIFGKAHSIENYTYLDDLGLPHQANSATRLFQLGLDNTLNYKKFHLNSQAVFQHILSNSDILPLPEWVLRLNVFYKSLMFKEAANVQIGLKMYYFSQFKSRDYFAINNQFKLQNSDENFKIGNYPILDFYFNMRVKSMQIYLEAQHFNAPFKYNYFSAPYIPYSDFRLNIGLVWYIFT